MKMCEQILKKKTAPQYNSNSLNCKKKQEKANNSPSYRCAAINKKLKKRLQNLERLDSDVVNAYENNTSILLSVQKATGKFKKK